MCRSTCSKKDRAARPLLIDDEGLVDWQSDIRGLMGFADLATIDAQRAVIGRVLGRWLATDGAGVG